MICISCNQDRKFIDKEGFCILCRRGYGGNPTVIKIKNGANYINSTKVMKVDNYQETK